MWGRPHKDHSLRPVRNWQRHSPVGQPRNGSLVPLVHVWTFTEIDRCIQNWKLQLPPPGCCYRFRLLVYRDDLWSLASLPTMLLSKNTGFRLLFGSSWCCSNRVLAAHRPRLLCMRVPCHFFVPSSALGRVPGTTHVGYIIRWPTSTCNYSSKDASDLQHLHPHTHTWTHTYTYKLKNKQYTHICMYICTLSIL